MVHIRSFVYVSMLLLGAMPFIQTFEASENIVGTNHTWSMLRVLLALTAFNFTK